MTRFFGWSASTLFGYLSLCSGLCAEVIGIAGGGTNGSGNGNVFLVDSSRALIPVTASSTFGTVSIASVAMNSSALSIIYGNISSHNYGALVDSQGQVMQLSNSGSPNLVNLSAAINSSGNSILAGGNFGTPNAATADSAGNATTLSGYNTSSCFTPSGTGTLDGGTAINDSGLAVVGGHPGQNPNTGIYVGSVFPGSTTVNQVLCNNTGGSTSCIFSTAINQSGQAIAGGFLNGNRYATIFDATQASPVTTVITLPSGGRINSVAINEAGTALIGGVDSVNAAYATLVDPSGALQPFSGDPMPAQGAINSVDMSTGCVYGIMGGQDTLTLAAYAALMSPSGELSKIPDLPTGAGASINSVSMNAWGVSLIGGTYDGFNAYAALVAPSGALEQLNVTGPPISSVSLRNFVPSLGLSKRDLVFAQYINDFAPEIACFFIPSLVAEKFREALQSAAPTRNAISLFVADNNLFVLNKGLSVHLRHQRHFNNQIFSSRHDQIAMDNESDDLVDTLDYFEESGWDSRALIASSDDAFDFYYSDDELLADTDPLSHGPYFHSSSDPDRPTTLWFEAIGYMASQKAQHRTVGFDPYAGGFILAIDHAANQHWRAGAGMAYTLAYVREHRHAGHSHINQEYLFTYTTWTSQHFYFDGALWGGAFQIEQQRNIDLGRFHFHAKSSPKGWQLSPHVEFGYEYAIATQWFQSSPQSSGVLISPFAMIDWVNAWQGRYKEKGNSPFNAGQKSHYSSFLRAEAGLRVYEHLAFSSWRLIFEEAVSYVNKTPFNVGKMQTFFVGIPGSVTLETLDDSENFGALELSTQFDPFDQAYPYGSLTYYGEFSGSFISHQLSLEMGWNF